MHIEKSKKLYEQACKVIPAGVSSPVRAFKAVGGNPIYMKSGQGPYIHDVDGNQYLDFVMSWGPLIHGHANQKIIKKIIEAAHNGTSFGTPCEDELNLARFIVDSYKSIDQVRFVSSGTEAVMSAIRLARGFTGRDLIIKFDGCYHGHVDPLLVSAGSGLVTLGNPSSLGIPHEVSKQTISLPLNHIEQVKKAFIGFKDQIAAVIIEPIPANNGLLLQKKEFILGLRELCDENHALLIFDEVISGFRVAQGGASEILDINPDLVTFGKVIGGGLPAGAFGATREIMNHIAPNGGVYQAGTLSGNPLAMAAGFTSLQLLHDENSWEYLESLGSYLEEKVKLMDFNKKFNVSFVRQGSIFWFALDTNIAPRRSKDINAQSEEKYASIFNGLLKNNIYIAPSMYEVGFLSTSHNKEHVDHFIQSIYQLMECLN